MWAIDLVVEFSKYLSTYGGAHKPALPALPAKNHAITWRSHNSYLKVSARKGYLSPAQITWLFSPTMRRMHHPQQFLISIQRWSDLTWWVTCIMNNMIGLQVVCIYSVSFDQVVEENCCQWWCSVAIRRDIDQFDALEWWFLEAWNGALLSVICLLDAWC